MVSPDDDLLMRGQARAAAAQAVEHATETGDDALDLRREVEARLGLVPSSE
ncbi:MAG: hypothetical protein KC501_37635 [Myxococcales bacterium]|nr:hypothetical protein [Myxococcales bacterium]